MYIHIYTQVYKHISDIIKFQGAAIRKKWILSAIMKSKVEKHCFKSHRSVEARILFCFVAADFFLIAAGSRQWEIWWKSHSTKRAVDFLTSACGPQCRLNGPWFCAQHQSISSPDILGNALLKTKYIANHNRPRAWLDFWNVLSCHLFQTEAC